MIDSEICTLIPYSLQTVFSGRCSNHSETQCFGDLYCSYTHLEEVNSNFVWKWMVNVYLLLHSLHELTPFHSASHVLYDRKEKMMTRLLFDSYLRPCCDDVYHLHIATSRAKSSWMDKIPCSLLFWLFLALYSVWLLSLPAAGISDVGSSVGTFIYKTGLQLKKHNYLPVSLNHAENEPKLKRMQPCWRATSMFEQQVNTNASPNYLK